MLETNHPDLGASRQTPSKQKVSIMLETNGSTVLETNLPDRAPANTIKAKSLHYVGDKWLHCAGDKPSESGTGKHHQSKRVYTQKN